MKIRLAHLIKKQLSDVKHEQINLASDTAVDNIADKIANMICGKFYLVEYGKKDTAT